MTMRKKSFRLKRYPRSIQILLVLLLAVAALLIGVAVTSAADNDLPMPIPYTNEDFVYHTVGRTAMLSGSSMASKLCVGDNNVQNDTVTLEGNEHGALFSLDDHSVLFAKGMYEKIYPASITKLMTAILALKYGNLDDTVTINWQDVSLESGSQVVGFRIGDKVKMQDLLYGLLVHSGNDCAQAIARHVGGSQKKFVAMMNEEAVNLGCMGTHFVNPTGLHDDDHYTTVYDIYLMLNQAVSDDTFVSIMQVGVYDLQYEDADGNEKHVTLDSTDHYLTGEADPPKNVTVLGGKTGTTDNAGNCLAIESQNAYGQPYISVIVGAGTKETLYEDMNSLLSLVNQ